MRLINNEHILFLLINANWKLKNKTPSYLIFIACALRKWRNGTFDKLASLLSFIVNLNDIFLFRSDSCVTFITQTISILSLEVPLSSHIWFYGIVNV